MEIPVGNTLYEVGFEDWSGRLMIGVLNRSYIQKFGLDMAEVTIFMGASSDRMPICSA